MSHIFKVILSLSFVGFITLAGAQAHASHTSPYKNQMCHDNVMYTCCKSPNWSAPGILWVKLEAVEKGSPEEASCFSADWHAVVDTTCVGSTGVFGTPPGQTITCDSI